MELVQLGLPDYDRVMTLWQRAGLPVHSHGRDSRNSFASQLESGVQVVLGVEREGMLVGVVVVTHDSRKGWINRLAVDPILRRQGIGARLIQAAEEHLHSQGIEVIAALIEDENEASQYVFGQAGYRLMPEIGYFSKRPNSHA